MSCVLLNWYVLVRIVYEIFLVPRYPYFLSVFFDCKALQKRRRIESNETYRVQTVYFFVYSGNTSRNDDIDKQIPINDQRHCHKCNLRENNDKHNDKM